MFRKLLVYLTLPLVLFLGNSSGDSASRGGVGGNSLAGLNPGPDIITGDMEDLEEYGSDGVQVGLGISTTSCNAGTVPVDFFALPNTDHPIIPHNFYRMSGGADNTDHFEQVGHSWVKHAFGADQFNTCGFGCIPEDFTHLGAGCSDTYLSFQNAEQDALGSRALVNPFTGVFQSSANNHNGHVHTETSHRIVVNISDLNENLNAGATYYAEVQYISPHEYAWCQGHPGQCNMYNNSSYRQYSVSGTTFFFFSEVGDTVRMTPAVHAWTGATINPIEPEPGVDGRAFVAYKVTGPVAGVYHYEYAIYNENLDRAIQSFSLPLGCGLTVTNLGFHAPPNHPGFPNDGTAGGAGFSNAAWSATQTSDALTWSTETFAQNQNANAIRWGTLYNFRFDSVHGPIATNATIGFFKTGTPITVAIQGPDPCAGATPSPTATGTPATPTPTPSLTPGVTPSPTPGVQALNISSRIFVQTGESVGVGGFIIAGTAPKQVVLHALGPSLCGLGIPNCLVDPVLELHGPPGFVTIVNDNWQSVQSGSCFCLEACPPPPVPPPTNGSESAICATLNPGAYTAVVSGKDNTSGVALVEIYDVDQAAPAKLANISTRAFVSTGAEVLIAGFILGGNTGSDQVVVRGIGPSLTDFGVSNALANPTLELHNGNGTPTITNNDWQDDPTQAAELTAAGLAPTNPLESGIVATLPPGYYTAVLAGMNNGTGVGLVEVYDRGEQ